MRKLRQKGTYLQNLRAYDEKKTLANEEYIGRG